jgi:hypothetical protein
MANMRGCVRRWWLVGVALWAALRLARMLTVSVSDSLSIMLPCLTADSSDPLAACTAHVELLSILSVCLSVCSLSSADLSMQQRLGWRRGDTLHRGAPRVRQRLHGDLAAHGLQDGWRRQEVLQQESEVSPFPPPCRTGMQLPFTHSARDFYLA